MNPAPPVIKIRIAAPPALADRSAGWLTHAAGDSRCRVAFICITEDLAQLAKQQQSPVAVRKLGIGGGYRPGDAEHGIVPAYATLMRRRIVVIDLVDNLGVRLQRAEAMGKSRRDEDLVPIPGAQHCCDMLTIRRRTGANIDGDIEERAAQHAQKLRLGEGCDLKMETAHDAALARQRVIVLNKIVLDPNFRKRALAEGHRKEAAIVEVARRAKQLDVAQSGIEQFHGPDLIRSGVEFSA